MVLEYIRKQQNIKIKIMKNNKKTMYIYLYNICHYIKIKQQKKEENKMAPICIT